MLAVVHTVPGPSRRIRLMWGPSGVHDATCERRHDKHAHLEVASQKHVVDIKPLHLRHQLCGAHAYPQTMRIARAQSMQACGSVPRISSTRKVCSASLRAVCSFADFWRWHLYTSQFARGYTWLPALRVREANAPSSPRLGGKCSVEMPRSSANVQPPHPGLSLTTSCVRRSTPQLNAQALVLG